MKEQSEYAIEKEKKQQKLVRNEFLYYNMSAGKYDFPIIKKQDIDPDKIKFLSFADAKKEDSENRDKTIHFLPTTGNLKRYMKTRRRNWKS